MIVAFANVSTLRLLKQLLSLLKPLRSEMQVLLLHSSCTVLLQLNGRTAPNQNADEYGLDGVDIVTSFRRHTLPDVLVHWTTALQNHEYTSDLA